MANLLTCQRLIAELTAQLTNGTAAQRAALRGALGAATVAGAVGVTDTEAVQDIIGAMVAAAGGTYDDVAGTITLPSGGATDTEAVQDIIGAMVVAAGGTYNDVAGTIALPSGGATDTEAVQDIIGAMVAAAGGAYNDVAGTITLPSGGAPSTAWQTVTPVAPDTTPVALTYFVATVARPNILLQPPVSASHVVQPATDAPDGATYEILLVGGGAAGLWQAWSSGAPATQGFVFPGGAAPTSPPTGAYGRSIFVRRRGAKHVAMIGVYDEEI